MSVMRSGPAVAMLAAMLLAASAGAARAGAPGLPASEIDSLRVEGERFYREAVEADSGDPAAAADLYRKAILGSTVSPREAASGTANSTTTSGTPGSGSATRGARS